jgi:hypothetical protein
MADRINPDTPDDDLTAGGIEKHREAFMSAKARFSVDPEGVTKLHRAFGPLIKSVRELKLLFEGLGTAADRALGSIGRAAGATKGTFSASGGSTPAGGIQDMPDHIGGATSGTRDYFQSSPLAKDRRTTAGGDWQPPPPPTLKGMLSDAKGSSVWGKLGRTLTADSTGKLGAGAQIATALVQASAENIKGRAEYTLEADRTGLLMRQMHGGTQLQYQARWRQPMTDRMLGPGGIPTMMNLQTTMGINPESMAAGVEGIRVASGFGYSTADATAMISAMAQPGSSNMMTMMLGGGLYGPGGKARDPMDVVRNTVQRMGLTSESMVEGAFQPGSMTRANLSRTGLPQDMQNLVLQYAKENLEFKKKGGKGMYDPSKEQDRRRMGIEESYAMEREKTSMAEVNRSEDFYRRQVDNYAQLEKNTQKLIRTFGALEDKLSGLVGAQTSATNHPALRIGSGVAMAAGALMIATGFGAPVGAALLAGGTVAGAIGDVPEITEPGMDAGFKGKLRAMAKAADKEDVPLSLTSGIRSPQRQRELFLERHDEDPEGNRSFEGKTYSLNAVGKAKGYAAPPGSSLHEVGLAADLGPKTSYGWIVANAHRFGLRHGDSFGEPWHVAPAGMTRAKHNAANPQPATTSAAGHVSHTRTGASRSAGVSAGNVSAGNVHMTKGMGIAESIKAIESANVARVSAGVGDDGGGGSVITIAPVIHLNGSGNDASDAQRLAQKVINMIETSEAVRSLRRS